MFYLEEKEEIEDKTEEVDYPESEVDEYDDSEDEEMEDEDEEMEDEDGLGSAPPAPPAAGVVEVKPFVGGSRLLVEIEPTPVAYFQHLVDDGLLAALCDHTNRQAALEGCEEFVPCHLDEMKVFVGILMHAKNGVRGLYGDCLFMPRFHLLFAKSMSKDRFLEILRRLHFSPQPMELTSIGAVGIVLDHFNTKMESTYSPGRELCVYNSVVIWRGVVICRERVARQLDGKHGVAVDALTDPSGVTLRLRVSPQALELERAGSALATRVVSDLTRGLIDARRALYLDPFYCTASIARYMLARDTYCTGILDGAYRPRHEDGVLVAQWSSGGRQLSYLTTEFVESAVGAAAGGSRRTAPAVAAYMRATQSDSRDEQMRVSPGAAFRLRWHKHVFLLALHSLARNARQLYNRYSGNSVSSYKFLTEVTLALLPVSLDDLTDDDDRDDDDDSDNKSRQL